MKQIRIRLLLVTCIIVFCGFTCSTAFAGNPDGTAEKQGGSDYEHTLFDTGFVHQINIILSDEDWGDLLANPVDKTKYKADIEIDGEKIENVSFATKGNSSLYIVAADPDSSRYSFRVNL